MTNYISVTYNEADRPKTQYPDQLAKHLFDKFNMKPNMKLLEAGCGRGDVLKGFQKLGLDVFGLDLSEEAIDLNPGIEIKIADIEHDKLPYPDATFDIVYSKSLLEHFYYPERYMKEAYRVLKPGGLLLTLVPDWEANYKTYFDDYTHRTPFSSVALNDIYKIFNFTDVDVIKFRQLPIVWKYPVLNYFCAAIAPFVPVRTKVKFLFWSREIMLIGAGTKGSRVNQ